MAANKPALIVIDIQNDYFPDGRFPLANTEVTLKNIEASINKAKEKSMPVILVQHISSNEKAPFFVKGTDGAKIHQKILDLVPDAPIVTKEYADSFFETNLEEILKKQDVTDLLVCGMMTQNCVTHTAVSKSAENYKVSVLGDCCSTVSDMINAIALRAFVTRLPVINHSEM